METHNVTLTVAAACGQQKHFLVSSQSLVIKSAFSREIVQILFVSFYACLRLSKCVRFFLCRFILCEHFCSMRLQPDFNRSIICVYIWESRYVQHRKQRPRQVMGITKSFFQTVKLQKIDEHAPIFRHTISINGTIVKSWQRFQYSESHRRGFHQCFE